MTVLLSNVIQTDLTTSKVFVYNLVYIKNYIKTGGIHMLTDTQIKACKLTIKGKTNTLTDGEGLLLFITHTGKYWRFRFRFIDKQQIMTFGQYPSVSLDEARKRRAKVKELLAKGIDPREQQQSDTNTFDKIAALWLENWKANKSENHINRVIRRYQLNIQPQLGNKLIKDITTKMVIDLVIKVNSRGARDVASRILNHISQIFRFAIVHEYITYNPITIKPADILPAHTITNLARIEERELGVLLQRIEAYQGTPITRIAIKLIALTFVRTGELIGAKWSEFDFANARWNIPAIRMKMRKPHIVPLAKQTISLLNSLKYITGANEYLFPSDTRTTKATMSNNTILQALKRMGYQGKMTGHGFRGLASTILHEQEYNHDHIELQLAHSPRNTVSAAYNHALYLEPRAKMMQDWADYLDRRRNE
ncbi:MAG: tyrosine-type recombinase/integrase [Burkholderiales bacterium]|nr:tyrosine-type recombinase/integrase [Burkholderiales bacterium]